MQQARKSNDEVNGMPTGKPSVRDRLIEEGLIELNLYGINDFRPPHCGGLRRFLRRAVQALCK